MFPREWSLFIPVAINERLHGCISEVYRRDGTDQLCVLRLGIGTTCPECELL